ncbi:MAG: tRNA pseudouridine(13) synthase TruD [Chloroflexi bacterium]|nr:tRNA pseudouridine(13) synthase TruD [Chloroflexota bacterium]
MAVPLPSYRAAFAPEGLAESARYALAQEEIALNDLKARILKRAYLPRGSRALLLFPTEIRVEAPQEDEHSPGRQAVRVQFTLPSGSYATVVIQAAMALALGTR